MVKALPPSLRGKPRAGQKRHPILPFGEARLQSVRDVRSGWPQSILVSGNRERPDRVARNSSNRRRSCSRSSGIALASDAIVPGLLTLARPYQQTSSGVMHAHRKLTVNAGGRFDLDVQVESAFLCFGSASGDQPNFRKSWLSRFGSTVTPSAIKRSSTPSRFTGVGESPRGKASSSTLLRSGATH